MYNALNPHLTTIPPADKTAATRHAVLPPVEKKGREKLSSGL
jgi:hypothetical protein